MPAKALWRPWDEENFKNPYPMYRVLQETDPIHFAQTGEWIITRHKDVKAILKDPRFVVGNRLDWLKRSIQYMNSKTMDFQDIAEAMNSFLLFINPPQHTRIRKFIVTQWSNHDVEQVIKENIDQLVKELAGKKDFDLVQDFAQHLPAMTMARILGIPSQDYFKLKNQGFDLIKALDLYISVRDLVTIHYAAHEFINYFRELISQQKYSPQGLLSRVCQANLYRAEPLSQNELISICIFLFTAGEETTASLIGTGILNLLTHTSPRDRQNMNWDLAIDELLRYDPPVHLLGRIASVDVVLDSKCIKRGETITLCLGAANRDKIVFKNPDKIDLLRQHNRHLAFGSGVHFCLGDWLAKLQGKIAIKMLLEVYPNLKIISDKLQWNNNLAIRSLSSLMVVKG